METLTPSVDVDGINTPGDFSLHEHILSEKSKLVKGDGTGDLDFCSMAMAEKLKEASICDPEAFTTDAFLRSNGQLETSQVEIHETNYSAGLEPVHILKDTVHSTEKEQLTKNSIVVDSSIKDTESVDVDQLPISVVCLTNGVGEHESITVKDEESDGAMPSTPETPATDVLARSQSAWSTPSTSLTTTLVSDGISYVQYEDESQMPDIMKLITKDLSEPYSIYTYRYFIHNWPKLCFLAMDEGKCVGAIVCKLDVHKKVSYRGYIAMLAVDTDYRRRKIGSTLVRKAIRAMILDENSCDEVVLETEITNTSALRLYENLGFVRDKRLFRYYLNGVDALRLKLWLR